MWKCLPEPQHSMATTVRSLDSFFGKPNAATSDPLSGVEILRGLADRIESHASLADASVERLTALVEALLSKASEPAPEPAASTEAVEPSAR